MALALVTHEIDGLAIQETFRKGTAARTAAADVFHDRTALRSYSSIPANAP